MRKRAKRAMDVGYFFDEVKVLRYRLTDIKHTIEFRQDGMYILRINEEDFKSVRLITHYGIKTQIASLENEIRDYVTSKGLRFSDSDNLYGGYLVSGHGYIPLGKIHEYKNAIKNFKNLISHFNCDFDVSLYGSYILIYLSGEQIFLYKEGRISWDGLSFSEVNQSHIDRLKEVTSGPTEIGIRVNEKFFDTVSEAVFDALNKKGIYANVVKLGV